ncbi:hypothetical protein ASC89_12470 [Devosia sp. Root413D1]|nr:hypothetical protein ASC89_12470 [Devosia sp. Root413D1]
MLSNVEDNAKDNVPSEACVWLSVSHIKSELLFGFTCDLIETNLPAVASLIQAFRQGVAVEGGQLPSTMWIRPQRAAQDRNKLPHLFSAAGFLTVSEEFAEVLSGFDLGQTRLYPVELLHSNRREAFPGRYYFLNIAEVHRYFSPEHSARFERIPNPATTYVATIEAEAQDDDVTVIPAALNGPDLWIDDTFRSHFFCSDRLAQTLRAAKVASHLPLFRCRVLTPS